MTFLTTSPALMPPQAVLFAFATAPHASLGPPFAPTMDIPDSDMATVVLPGPKIASPFPITLSVPPRMPAVRHAPSTTLPDSLFSPFAPATGFPAAVAPFPAPTAQVFPANVLTFPNSFLTFPTPVPQPTTGGVPMPPAHVAAPMPPALMPPAPMPPAPTPATLMPSGPVPASFFSPSLATPTEVNPPVPTENQFPHWNQKVWMEAIAMADAA